MFQPKKNNRLSRARSRQLILLIGTALTFLLLAIFTKAIYALLAIPFFAAFIIFALGHHRCPACGKLLLGRWWLFPLSVIFWGLDDPLDIFQWDWKILEDESRLALHLRWSNADAGYCDFCGHRLLYDDQP